MPRNYDIAELRRLDVAHHLPAQADWQEIENLGGSRIITHADGCYIHDGDGNRILDGMAGLWCVNVGYGREELVEVAAEQMRELPFYNTFFKTATPPTVLLAEKIASLTQNRLPHVFFNASGSEANDTIFRLVRQYWKLKGEPHRKTFISRWNAYHGSTVAGVSLGGMKAMHAIGDLPFPGIEHVRQPYWFNEGRDMTAEEFGNVCAQAIEDKIVEVGAENVAAFIGEPVQGAGGVIIPPANYWPQVEAICRKYGILLICDEVICGFGRTGSMWGHETVSVKPDIIAMAKGLSSGYLPISAVAVSADIIKVMKPAAISFTATLIRAIPSPQQWRCAISRSWNAKGWSSAPAARQGHISRKPWRRSATTHSSAKPAPSACSARSKLSPTKPPAHASAEWKASPGRWSATSASPTALWSAASATASSCARLWSFQLSRSTSWSALSASRSTRPSQNCEQSELDK